MLAVLVCEIFIIHTTCYSIILTTSFVFNIILNIALLPYYEYANTNCISLFFVFLFVEQQLAVFFSS